MRLGVLVLASAPLLFAAARLGGLDSAAWPLSPLSAWFALQCHQLPERSALWLPICWRCTGLYLGLGLGAWFPQRRLVGKWLGLSVAVAGLVLAADVLTEAWHLRPPSAALRTLTGLLLAFPIGSRAVQLGLGQGQRPLRVGVQ